MMGAGGGYRPAGSQGTTVLPMTYTAMFEEPLPLDEVSVPANGTASIRKILERPFRGNKLILLPEDVGLLITDIKVMNKSIYPAAGNGPVEAFGATVYQNNIRIETAQIGGSVQIDFENTTAAALTVSGYIFGATLDD